MKSKNRIIKLILNKKTIVAILISAILGFICISFNERSYNKFYSKNFEKINITGLIISNKEETEYYNKYILKCKNKKFILYTPKKTELQYGDIIKTEAEYSEPQESRNYKGFNYKEYLKTKKIYGILKAKQFQIIDKNKASFGQINKLRISIKNKINTILPKDTASILNSLLIGFKEEISEENVENFSLSSLSHLLAISGTHIAIMIYIFTLFFSVIKFPTKLKHIFMSIILLVFIVITGFTESVVRASISSIILILSKIFYRKRDILTSISIPILISLILNPYLINSISLQLSYSAVLGVIYIAPLIQKFISKYIPKKISDAISITIAAQLSVLPIILINFNVFSFSFIISNLLAIPLLSLCIILGIITVFISYFSIFIAKKISIILNLSLQLLIFISKTFSTFSIYIVTLNSYLVFLYYILLIIYGYYFYTKNLPTISFKMKKRIMIKLIQKSQINKLIIITSIVIISVNTCLKTLNKDFAVYFIDVGQGDSSLIVTNTNKKILIDTGENGVLDYLLDRKVCKLDYILISHFDSDHCGGVEEIIKSIKVKNVIIAKQMEEGEDFKKIINIARKKKVNIITVQTGDKIKIDEKTSIEILWPYNNNLITSENVSNNNAVVAKLKYMETTILFTGDIEEIAEKELIKYCGGHLKSTILKVAHHGSKTSSTSEFLNLVTPKIALIGVGKDNKFGHPNSEVLERLKQLGSKIYRTDENGEIILKIKKDGTIKLKKHIGD